MINKYLIILHESGRVGYESKFFNPKLIESGSDRVKKNNKII
jgi:hypothetical protein